MARGLATLLVIASVAQSPLVEACVVQRFAFGISVADFQSSLATSGKGAELSASTAHAISDRYVTTLAGERICHSDSRFAGATIDFVFYYDRLAEISITSRYPDLEGWFSSHYGARPSGSDLASSYTIARGGALSEYWFEGSRERIIITSTRHEELIRRYHTGEEAGRFEHQERARLASEEKREQRNSEIARGERPPPQQPESEVTPIDENPAKGGEP